MRSLGRNVIKLSWYQQTGPFVLNPAPVEGSKHEWAEISHRSPFDKLRANGERLLSRSERPLILKFNDIGSGLYRSLFCLGFLFLAASNGPRAEAPSDPPVTRIAFGSCNKQDQPQPLWDVIGAGRPELWIWLGDAIYGDTEDMDLLAAKWRQQKEVPAYARFRAAVKVLGTWDDHDYGINDGGAAYPKQAESQRLFLDFLDEPADSPRRRQKGVYTSRSFGPEGNRICVVLLDERTFRAPPHGEGDILGEAQWAWLEGVLKSSRAQLHIVGSGSQILPVEHRFEKWADYPGARARLLKLLASVKNPLLLSGDRHFGEISKLAFPKESAPLYEVTSSGLTHHGSIKSEPNSWRVGEIFQDLNYGTLEINWAARRAVAALHDAQGTLVRSVTLELEP